MRAVLCYAVLCMLQTRQLGVPPTSASTHDTPTTAAAAAAAPPSTPTCVPIEWDVYLNPAAIATTRLAWTACHDPRDAPSPALAAALEVLAASTVVSHGSVGNVVKEYAWLNQVGRRRGCGCGCGRGCGYGCGWLRWRGVRGRGAGAGASLRCVPFVGPGIGLPPPS